MVSEDVTPILKLLRPRQWIKNLLLLFPPFFGGSMVSPEVAARIIPAFFSFCAAASASYIINDIRDIDADRNHAEKKRRPLASGDITIGVALAIALLLLALSISVSFFVSDRFWWYVAAYLAVTLSYTFILKDAVILDIFAISLGFLVRVLAGGEASDMPVSDWLFMSVFLVALFLATGKRLGELVSMGSDAHNHRRSLAGYTPAFLEGALWFSASAALVTYALYAIEHGEMLFYTTPVAAFGLLRYIYIAREGQGDPTEALLKDKQIMVAGALWAAIIGVTIYC